MLISAPPFPARAATRLSERLSSVDSTVFCGLSQNSLRTHERIVLRALDQGEPAESSSPLPARSPLPPPRTCTGDAGKTG